MSKIHGKKRVMLISALRQMGIRIVGKKIYKEDFRKIFGAAYQDPEWILLMDYKFKTPYEYVSVIEKEEMDLGRQILPTSYSIARYGKFLDNKGDQICLDGMVYQYSMQRNPRNVSYAFKLFLEGEPVAKSSGLRSLAEAQQECSEQAKTYIEEQLYDLA